MNKKKRKYTKREAKPKMEQMPIYLGWEAMNALREAKVVIELQNNGNCLVSVLGALKLLEEELDS